MPASRSGLVAAAVLVALLTGCASRPITNLYNEPVPSLVDGSSQPMDAVQRAILAACSKRGWTARVVEPGLIEATILVRSTHRATVKIPYSASHYSILYEDSQNLDHHDGKIHRNYNRWIVKLSGSIQRELGVRTQNF